MKFYNERLNRNSSSDGEVVAVTTPAVLMNTIRKAAIEEVDGLGDSHLDYIQLQFEQQIDKVQSITERGADERTDGEILSLVQGYEGLMNGLSDLTSDEVETRLQYLKDKIKYDQALKEAGEKEGFDSPLVQVSKIAVTAVNRPGMTRERVKIVNTELFKVRAIISGGGDERGTPEDFVDYFQEVVDEILRMDDEAVESRLRIDRLESDPEEDGKLAEVIPFRRNQPEQ